MGNQSVRYELLIRLVRDTNLVVLPNARFVPHFAFITASLIQFYVFRGENILLFLAQTVGRQNQEQRQYRTARPRAASSNSRNKTPSSDSKFW